MTTGITVMNKSGIALAVDSAVTITLDTPQGRKIKTFNTANKLFTLSKYAPIGIMIYGNATLMGIPWEIIVKCYRKKLGRKKFNTVKEYCDDFFKYLSTFDIGQGTEKDHVCNVALSIISGIRKNLDEYVKTAINKKGQVSEDEIRGHIQNCISKDKEAFSRLASKAVLGDSELNGLKQKYHIEINNIIDSAFKNLPFSKEQKDILSANIYTAISIPRKRQSGIVISGFGEREIFPLCCEFNIDAIISGKVLKEDGRYICVDDDHSANILPFAQIEEIVTFMEGIGPNISRLTKNGLSQIMSLTFPNNIAAALTSEFNFDDKSKNKINQIVMEIGKGVFDEFEKNLNIAKNRYYVGPILRAVNFLNKEELAQMAETLVSLASFRKQVTLEDETVGGPIDVALITKGDGLIWIKRKHYFDKELNPHFLSNYFDSGDSDNGRE